ARGSRLLYCAGRAEGAARDAPPPPPRHDSARGDGPSIRRAPALDTGSPGGRRVAATEDALMQLGFVGLGRMGGNMVTRLVQGGHRLVAWDPSADAVKRARDNGADSAGSLVQPAKAIDAPPATST